MTIRYKNQGYKQTGTGKTTVFTCPTDATVIVKSIYCAKLRIPFKTSKKCHNSTCYTKSVLNRSLMVTSNIKIQCKFTTNIVTKA